MSRNEQTEGSEEAREAAQHVADSAESWEHASEKPEIREHVERGLDEAGVAMAEEDKERVVEQVRDDEEKPIVDAAHPEDR